MTNTRTLAASLAIAAALSAFASVPSYARDFTYNLYGDEPAHSHLYARGIDEPSHRQAYANDLWRYYPRDGATVWLPGTNSPRVGGR